MKRLIAPLAAGLLLFAAAALAPPPASHSQAPKSKIKKKARAGAHVYVIDTGIRTTHTQFGGRASVAFDSVGDGQNGNDCNGHGTHVAGTIGGSTYGVAKGVTLHAVRVLDCSGGGTDSTVVA